jgi:2'-5' RNA ligase
VAVERDGAGYAETTAATGSVPIASVRAFVAVHLDADTRAALATAAGALRQHGAGLPVAWVAPDNLHLTLKFLGGIDEARVQSVIDALHTAVRGHPPFDIEVGGLGAFPSRTRARALWAGFLAGGDRLAALAAAVDDALAGLGVPREDRAFSPHITLGRVRAPGRAPALADALTAGAAQRFGRVAVAEVALMRSDLSPRGARYTRLATIPL